ncbi:NACHT, LRR and PYD domains-containing protein 1 homolog isoform X2 [Narcine bancroftii]
MPCTFPSAAWVNLNNLVISWQRTYSQAVVHSFYSGLDHSEDQNPTYRGRSQLFLMELPKGNASIKLNAMSLSDVGNYTCYVVDEEGIFQVENTVELKLFDITQQNGINGNGLIYVVGPAGLIVLIAGGFLHWKIKNKKRPALEEEICLLRDGVKAAIQNYKQYILKDQAHSCYASMQGNFSSSSFARSINVISPKLQDPDYDLIQKGNLNIESEMKASQLLSMLQKATYTKRVLLLGDPGIGKSWTVDSIEQEWASHPLHLMSCVIVLRFSDLNRVKGKTTLRELLTKQCPPLSSVLMELLQNCQDVLIILDGLDEFNHQLQWHPSDFDFNLDSEAEVSVLVAKLISGNLLREAFVLVTTRWNTKQIEFNKSHFDYYFVISSFTNDQLRRYCEVFCGEKQKAEEMYLSITENESIKCMAYNPLNSYILCNILKSLGSCFCSQEVTGNAPMTSTKVFSLLLHSLFNCSTVTDKTELERKLFKHTILKVGEHSFITLLSGKLEISAADLKTYEIDQSMLSKQFSHLILENLCKDQGSFAFCHTMLKEQFAALYCANSLNDDTDELVKCLNLWCFGKKPKNQMSQFYLQSFQPKHTEKLYNFTKFLMGFLTTRRDGKLWDFTSPLTPSTARGLITWFKNSLEQDLKQAELLNLIHCLFELHDPIVTTEVSPCIKRIEFHNVPLSPLDVSALCYCLSQSTVEVLDLRLCRLRDEGIKQLKDVLFKCRTLLVSSNKLTEDSAKILSNILQNPECRIETLSCGTNSFGSTGAQYFWEALANNQSLKVLRLYDNKIMDEGTKNMNRYLTCNKTLQKLYLCANELGDLGQRNIQQVEEIRTDLKIIIKITDDEELLLRVETQVKELLSFRQKYDKEFLQKIMNTILKDLGDESCIPNLGMRVRVGNLKANILQLIPKNKDMMIDIPSHKSWVKLHSPTLLPV